MAHELLAWLSSLIIDIIEYAGYGGIFVLSVLESANIPIPSEVILPFSGFLVAEGEFAFWFVVLAASLGNVVGSWASYELGRYGGRSFLRRWGKFLLLSPGDVELAERWFTKYGGAAVFFSRLLPIVRTFISFPAGIAKMPRVRFLTLTFAGSLPWNMLLAYVGVVLGENWRTLEGYFRALDWVILILIIAVIGLWVWRHVRNNVYA
jgi:membrane protein DedA with SNARE-associated domain